jgi:hypothetical protein
MIVIIFHMQAISHVATFPLESENVVCAQFAVINCFNVTCVHILVA